MRLNVRYTHEPSGEFARTYPITREDAIEIARQFTSDGERDVVIEIEAGDTSSPEAL